VNIMLSERRCATERQGADQVTDGFGLSPIGYAHEFERIGFAGEMRVTVKALTAPGKLTAERFRPGGEPSAEQLRFVEENRAATLVQIAAPDAGRGIPGPSRRWRTNCHLRGAGVFAPPSSNCVVQSTKYRCRLQSVQAFDGLASGY